VFSLRAWTKEGGEKNGKKKFCMRFFKDSRSVSAEKRAKAKKAEGMEEGRGS
jgi:hypothetical protein